jgi:hypothetical protein
MHRNKFSTRFFLQDTFIFYGDIPMHRSVQESQQCDLLCHDGENQQLGTNSVHIMYLCEMVVVRDEKVPM